MPDFLQFPCFNIYQLASSFKCICRIFPETQVFNQIDIRCTRSAILHPHRKHPLDIPGIDFPGSYGFEDLQPVLPVYFSIKYPVQCIYKFMNIIVFEIDPELLPPVTPGCPAPDMIVPWKIIRRGPLDITMVKITGADMHHSFFIPIFRKTFKA